MNFYPKVKFLSMRESMIYGQSCDNLYEGFHAVTLDF